MPSQRARNWPSPCLSRRQSSTSRPGWRSWSSSLPRKWNTAWAWRSALRKLRSAAPDRTRWTRRGGRWKPKSCMTLRMLRSLPVTGQSPTPWPPVFRVRQHCVQINLPSYLSAPACLGGTLPKTCSASLPGATRHTLKCPSSSSPHERCFDKRTCPCGSRSWACGSKLWKPRSVSGRSLKRRQEQQFSVRTRVKATKRLPRPEARPRGQH
mmetsp:Transcript_28183/g.52865  ORF Transcript_28183/g.52865 Transcript_28183/m.52865 type:complete len:210 (+) Transcript_28183:302-931(+)